MVKLNATLTSATNLIHFFQYQASVASALPTAAANIQNPADSATNNEAETASLFVAESSGCCSSSAAPAAANSAFSARRRRSEALQARGGARKYGPRNVGKGKTTANPLLPRASGGVHGRLRVLTRSQPSNVGKLAFSGPRRPLQQCWRQGRRSTASLHLSGKAKG